jgi:ribosomal RNA-processing protein 17
VGISRDGFSRPGDHSDDDQVTTSKPADGEEGAVEELGKKSTGKPEIKRDANGKRIWTKERPKKKKFRYETKAERKVERAKQGAKKRKQKEARSKKD